MKRILAPLVVAVLLFVAGLATWMLGQAEERVARAKSQLSTLDYGALASDAGSASDDAVGDDGLDGPSLADATVGSFGRANSASRVPSVSRFRIWVAVA